MQDHIENHSLTPRSVNYLSLLYGFLLSLTAAFSLAFASFRILYQGTVEGSMGDWKRPSKYLWVWYFFLRAGVRLNGVFHHAPQNFVEVWRSTISAAFFAAVITLWLLFFLSLNAVGRTRVAAVLLDPIAGIFLFTIFPLGGLLLPNGAVSERPPGPSPTLLLSLLVVAVVAGAIFLTRKWIFPAWLLLPMAAYYAFFAWVYYGRYSWEIWRGAAQFDYLAIPFFAVAVCTGIAWTLFARYRRQGHVQISGYSWGRLLAVAVPLFAVCCIPWLPAKSHSLAHPKNINSVSINLKRGGCRGTCPIYEIMIHGDGTAEYEGQMFVRTKGPVITNISPETVTRLLQSFDLEFFSTIDDRAFGVCFDAPHTIITVSADSYTKTVNVDDCLGNSRPKAGVLRIGKEIDDAVGSKQWVECHGGGCVWR